MNADVQKFFTDIQDAVARHPQAVKDINGIFQFNLKGHSQWIVDLKTPGGEVKQGTHPKPDTTIEYSSAADFVNINSGKLDIKRAILTGKFKVVGNMKVLAKMHEVFEAAKKADAAEEAKKKAEEQEAAYRARAPSYSEGVDGGDKASEGGLPPARSFLGSVPSPGGARSGLVPTWASDAAAKECTRCTSPFTFVRRKHHCRSCGRIFCQACSGQSLNGKRTCDFCMQRLHGIAPPDGIRYADPGIPATHAGVGASAPGTPGSNATRSSFAALGSVFSTGKGVAREASTLFSVQSPGSPMSAGSNGSLPVVVRLEPQHAAQPSTTATVSSIEEASTRAGAIVEKERRGSSASTGTQLSTAAPAPAPQRQDISKMQITTTQNTQRERTVSFPDEAPAQQPLVDSALLDKVHELESKLQALQSSVNVNQWIPEVQDPSVESILSRSELLNVILQPALYFLVLLGWRSLPLVLGYWGLTNLLSSSGSWFFALVWLGLCGWIVYAGVADTPSANLFRRRMRVYGAAIAVVVDYRITRSLVKQAGLDDKDSEAVWDAAHKRNAVRAFRIIRDLRGLWVKCGQYLSSRPDVMPPAYIHVLAALQDAMPARALAEVRATMEEDLGRPLDTVFSKVEEKALAAASIGQVHRGTLLDGTDVAIKVQHRGMDVIIGQDLDNLRIILSWLSYVETGVDMEGVMSEWLKEVTSELDFRIEAANMIEVRKNMMDTDMIVTVPRVIPNLFSRRVLVMRFMEGIKVNDLVKLQRLGINRDQLCDRVCRAYAHQIYRNGFFNGDPHPGNIMIVKRSILFGADLSDPEHDRLKKYVKVPENPDGDDDEWIPVLLDFGLTKRLPHDLRLAFAKLVVSAEEMDYAGMLEAMDKMGMRFSHESAAEDLENLQYMFRDATPASEARAKHEEREKAKAEKAEREKQKPKKDRKMTAWPSDIMFFLRSSELLQGLCSHLETRHPFMKTMAHAARWAFIDRVPQHLRIQTPVLPSKGPSSRLEHRLRDRLALLRSLDLFEGCQVYVWDNTTGKAVVNIAAGSMGPMDPRAVQPDSLFPVLGLSRLGAVAALQALVSRGKTTFDAHIDKYWPAFHVYGKGGCTISELLRGRSGVEGVIPEEMATSHFTRERWNEAAAYIAAAQPLVLPSLIVKKKSRAARLQSTIESAAAPAPALPPISETAQAPASGALSPDDVEEILDVAVSDVQGAGARMTQSFAVASSGLLPPALVPCFAYGRPNTGPSAPQEVVSHLWFGWGWAVGSLVSGIIDGPNATPPPLKKPEAKETGKKAAEATIPTPAAAAEIPAAGMALTNALADLVTSPLNLRGQMEFGLSSKSPVGANDNIATLCLGGSGALDAAPQEAPLAADAVLKMPALFADQEEDVTMAAAMSAMELAEGMTAAGLQELAALTAGGLEHLMDPRMVNIDKIRHALLPSTNLFASAEALARTLAFVVASGRQNPDIIGSAAALKDFYTLGDTSYHGAAAYAAHYSGMRLFTFEKEAAGKTTRTSTGVGMGSLGGSVVFADTAKNVTVAITVNRLTSDRALSKHLLDIIAEDLQLGKLVDF